MTSLLAAFAAFCALMAVIVVALQGRALARLRLLCEQALAGQRAEAASLRADLASTERALMAAGASSSGQQRQELASALHDMRTGLDTRLRELRDGNERKLADIQNTVNEQLHAAVEKQMSASFTRVTEQFAQVQQAMGEMQAVGAQIGDIKRLFSNVKTRGGWGETQVRAMLEDILQPNAYDTNWKPRADSDDVVEFAVIMPSRDAIPPRLPIDAKFPVEDYERMLLAAEAGDAEAERLARRGLERRIRDEAKKIGAKYISPPATVDFAILYLPTDGLYAEVARIPGLIDELGRSFRVLVLGPSLFPALLRTIHLGHVTLTIEAKAGEVRHLLGATRTEMGRMDDVLERLGKQAGQVSRTIEDARVRTRAVRRKLRGVDTVDLGTTDRLLELGDAADPDDAD